MSTPLELVETYPEALPIVKRNLRYWREYRKVVTPYYEQLLDNGMEMIYASDCSELEKEERIDKWKFFLFDHVVRQDGFPVPHGLTKHYNPAGIDLHIKRLEKIEYLFSHPHSDKKNPATIDDEDIVRAKLVAIATYLTPNQMGFVKCPFHNEKTASCKVYPDHAYCFGCSKKFDVIDLVMQLKGFEFLDAVKFILGK